MYFFLQRESNNFSSQLSILSIMSPHALYLSFNGHFANSLHFLSRYYIHLFFIFLTIAHFSIYFSSFLFLVICSAQFLIFLFNFSLQIYHVFFHLPPFLISFSSFFPYSVHFSCFSPPVPHISLLLSFLMPHNDIFCSNFSSLLSYYFSTSVS